MEKLKPAVAANSTMSGTAAAAGYRASFLGSESSDDDQASATSAAAADTSANLTPRCAIKRMKTEDDTVVVTSIEVRAREEYDCGRMTLRDRGAASPLTRIDLFKKCSVKKEEDEEEEEDEDEDDDDDDDEGEEEETTAPATTKPPPNMPTDEEMAAMETDDMTDYVEHLKSRAAEEAPPVPPSAEEMTSLLDLAKEAEEDQVREEEEAKKRRAKEEEEAAAAAAADMIAEEAAAAEAAAAAASTSSAGPSSVSSMSATAPFTSEPYDEPMLEMQIPVKLARSFHAYLGRFLDAYDHRQAALKAKERRRRILNIFDEESLSYEEEAGSSPIADGEGADIDIDDTASDIVRDTARRIGDPTLLGNLNPW